MYILTAFPSKVLAVNMAEEEVENFDFTVVLVCLFLILTVALGGLIATLLIKKSKKDNF